VLLLLLLLLLLPLERQSHRSSRWYLALPLL
jgi:hypothetical protein